MTDPKQISVMAARKTAYAWKASVTRNAGMSMSQKRISLAIVALFLSAGAAFAQGTILPPPIFTGLDSSGNPLVSGKLCTYVAGSSTPATTYTTSALNVANTNPVILDAAGRATVFLRPGSSYKFVLYSAGSDTTCNTGTLQWSQDNVSALPTSNVNLDFDGTAGESLAAGDVVYLKDSTGWYKTDADAAASSSEAAIIGMAPSAIASGATGTIRIKGLVTVTGPLTTATTYYVSATAGAVTATAPTLVRTVGVGYTATSILVSPANEGKLPALNSSYLLNALQLNRLQCGRLTGATATPYPISDQTAVTTIYFTPIGECNQIALYTSSSQWVVRTLAEISIAVPATTTSIYDVFVYDNAGTPALELSAAWNSATTRFAAGTYATLLPTQDGVEVKSGNGTTIDATRRYVGSFRTTGVSGQTEQSAANSFIFNRYNQQEWRMFVNEATASWARTSTTIRQANGSTANQLAVLIGVQTQAVSVRVNGGFANTGGERLGVGIGLDSTTAFAAGSRTGAGDGGAGGMGGLATWDGFTGIGYHTLVWLEVGSSVASGGLFYGTSGATVSGISATVWR